MSEVQKLALLWTAHTKVIEETVAIQSAGERLYQNQVNSTGAGCHIIGAISHDSSGATLSCKDSVWQSGSSSPVRACADRCGGRRPLEIGRVNHDGDWSSWNTLGEGVVEYIPKTGSCLFSAA